MKSAAIFVRIADDEKRELYRIAQILDVPFSQITREAIREKLIRLKQNHPLLAPAPMPPPLQSVSQSTKT